MTNRYQRSHPRPGRRPVTLDTHLGPHLPAEAEVARFGRYIVERRLAAERHAPYWLMWVRTFLERPARTGSTEDAIRFFLERMAHSGHDHWRLVQAEHSVRCFCSAWRNNPDAPRARLKLGADGKVADTDAIVGLRELARLRHSRVAETLADIY